MLERKRRKPEGSDDRVTWLDSYAVRGQLCISSSCTKHELAAQSENRVRRPIADRLEAHILSSSTTTMYGFCLSEMPSRSNLLNSVHAHSETS